jgi:hypothetical protein
VIPLTVKPEDLLIAKSGDSHSQRKVFTLPSVEVGSVLEYAYQLRFNAQFYWHLSPDWEVQKHYFVHKAHYQFAPFDNLNLIWWPQLPQSATVKTDVAGRYILDITDVPPIPDEEWMPPISSFLYKVQFYYRSPYDPLQAEAFWIAETKTWSKDLDHFAEPTNGIKAAVNGLIAPTDSDLDKAKKLYVAVQALDNTDYSRAKSDSERRQMKLKEITRAEDAWTQKSGTSNDIALLYQSMLRAAGLTAYGMKIVDRKYGVFDPSYLSLRQLNIALVILSIGGKEIILDPGEKMCPFGTLNWRHSEARGVRQSSGENSLMTTPAQAFADNFTTYNANVTVDEHGGMTGTFSIVMSGQSALYWRQQALQNDLSEVKKAFDHELETIIPEGVEAHLDQFMGIDHPNGNLVAMVNAKGTLGTATAKRLLLPGFFFETRSTVPFVNQETRLEPVDMHYGERINENVTYHYPDGFTVEGAPQDAKIVWPGHAIFVDKSTPDTGQILIAHSVVRAFALAKAEEYQDLRGFYQKIATANQQQLVLAKAAAAKGN